MATHNGHGRCAVWVGMPDFKVLAAQVPKSLTVWNSLLFMYNPAAPEFQSLAQGEFSIAQSDPSQPFDRWD